MCDDKYLTNSRMCCSALFNSSYSIIGLCLAHLRYYLPHSSTKWVLRLPCLMSVFTFVCSGPATLAFQIYKSFLNSLKNKDPVFRLIFLVSPKLLFGLFGLLNSTQFRFLAKSESPQRAGKGLAVLDLIKVIYTAIITLGSYSLSVSLDFN